MLCSKVPTYINTPKQNLTEEEQLAVADYNDLVDATLRMEGAYDGDETRELSQEEMEARVDADFNFKLATGQIDVNEN